MEDRGWKADDEDRGAKIEEGGSHSSQSSILNPRFSIRNPQSSPDTTDHRPQTTDRTVVTWCLSDGRTGHRRQIEGLVHQLAARRRLAVHWIPLDGLRHFETFTWWTRRRFPLEGDLPSPQLIVGAGHLTHAAALAARRARGGKTVILMRPTLPTRLFDLCLIPEHDLESLFSRFGRSCVVPTRGVLNPFVPASDADPSRVLVLLGGPSRHHGWSDEEILCQLRQVIRLSQSQLKWTVTTSRRTPASLVDRLPEALGMMADGREIRLVPCAKCGPGWLSDQLAASGTVFVTEDSVSMTYEALTVGADVGLLRVPRRHRSSRNARCIDRLVTDRLAIPFEQWQQTRFEHRQRSTFHEAARCADIVCERLLDAA